MCLLIFEEFILNIGDYIGFYLGIVVGYFDFFIGRLQDFLIIDLVLMEECCRNMDKLFDMYLMIVWEYMEVKDISICVVVNVRNVLIVR